MESTNVLCKYILDNLRAMTFADWQVSAWLWLHHFIIWNSEDILKYTTLVQCWVDGRCSMEYWSIQISHFIYSFWLPELLPSSVSASFDLLFFFIIFLDFWKQKSTCKRIAYLNIVPISVKPTTVFQTWWTRSRHVSKDWMNTSHSPSNSGGEKEWSEGDKSQGKLVVFVSPTLCVATGKRDAQRDPRV